jgi:sulfate adenylyltransferase subunit 1 (EFTu-like GTPase family)
MRYCQITWPEQISFIPISALNGDNIVDKSNSMDWYEGPACWISWKPCP